MDLKSGIKEFIIAFLIIVTGAFYSLLYPFYYIAKRLTELVN